MNLDLNIINIKRWLKTIFNYIWNILEILSNKLSTSLYQDEYKNWCPLRTQKNYLNNKIKHQLWLIYQSSKCSYIYIYYGSKILKNSGLFVRKPMLLIKEIIVCNRHTVYRRVTGTKARNWILWVSYLEKTFKASWDFYKRISSCLINNN